MAWDDAVDDLVVEILATTIKQFKKQEKFPRHDTTCAPTV